jgi:ubiquitin-protein ligase
MSSPRLRRLAADFQSVRAEYSGNQYAHVVPLGHDRPPEGYRVTYRLRGLRLEGAQPMFADQHEVEIMLPLGYPREKPICTPLTPVFHPNVKGYYCIQDYWAAGQPLVDTIAKIGDMIQYRIYNPRSPLDAAAARWSVENRALFPLGHVNLRSPEVAIALGGPVKPSASAESLVQLNADRRLSEVPVQEDFAITLRRGS